MNETTLREQICKYGTSLFQRGLSYGSSGNISIRLEDGYLFTPTNSCLGLLEPEGLSKLDSAGQLVNGDPPTKELSLHLAMYETRSDVNAIVHLHSTYCVALSCLNHPDHEAIIPPITPYFIMKIGRLALIPFFPPGDTKLGDAIRDAAQDHRVVLLANHGPVVGGKTLSSAVNDMEELEESAKLFFLLQGHDIRYLNSSDVEKIKKRLVK